MKSFRRILRIAVVLSVLPTIAGVLDAQDHAGHHEGDPVATVAMFHSALAGGDRDAVLGLLDPEVVIFESGGAELSREEYASHHLGSDMAFSAATDRAVVDQRQGKADDSAWVLTRTHTTGTWRDRDVDSRGAETMILRHGSEGWKIVHIHWSSRSAAGR